MWQLFHFDELEVTECGVSSSLGGLKSSAPILEPLNKNSPVNKNNENTGSIYKNF